MFDEGTYFSLKSVVKVSAKSKTDMRDFGVRDGAIVPGEWKQWKDCSQFGVFSEVW